MLWERVVKIQRKNVMDSQDLFQKLERIRAIGKAIAELGEESKALRKEVGKAVDEFGVGQVNEETFVRFLMGEATVVSVKKADKDFTILFEDIPKV